MAINLNPGADTTLVNVAYRAAMANTPADYSDTLERAADSYTKTMEASSEMWGKVAEIGAKLGGEMVKNANERAAYAAKTSALHPDDAKLLTDEIYAIKDDQKELGFLPGVFGDRETKKRLAELKMEQQDLFAEIDLAAASVKAGTDAVAAGTFDTKLAMNDGEMVNAIIKSGLKNRVTDNKNIAKLGRDEYGELMYTLHKENGELADNPNGTKEPVTMTIKQFNEAIATNVDDKGAKAAIFDAKNNKVADRGFKSRTGVYDEQMKIMDSNWLDTQLQEPVDLKRAMHMKFGYMETSFFDDLTKNKNVYSADLYKTLLKVTGGDNALTGVITDGIEDVGEPGINEVELKNSENYQVLTANILGMKDPEVTKAYFKDYVLKEFEETNNYGHGRKAPAGGETNADGKGGKYGGFGQFRVKTGGGGEQPMSITAATALQRRAYLDDFGQVDGEHGQYIWDVDKNLYIRQDDKQEMSMFEVAKDEGLIKPGENKNDFNPTRTATKNEEQKLLNKGLASPSMLKNVSNDDVAADKLNAVFKFESASQSDYFFVPYSDSYGIVKNADNVFSDDVMLIDGSTNKPVRDGNKIRRFGTKDNYNAKDLEWINNFLGEYKSKINTNVEFED